MRFQLKLTQTIRATSIGLKLNKFVEYLKEPVTDVEATSEKFVNKN